MKTNKNLTSHSDLVSVAEKWLYNKAKCSFVIKELSSIAGETPDAIGFRDGISILIECKISISDYSRDKKKIFRRRPHTGMGDHRFFMCPDGLIKENSLPKGWGLIYYNYKTGKVTVVSGGRANTEWYRDRPFEANLKNESLLLQSALRRVKLNGDLHKIFSHEK